MREELAEIVWHIYNVGVYIELSFFGACLLVLFNFHLSEDVIVGGYRHRQ